MARATAVERSSGEPSSHGAAGAEAELIGVEDAAELRGDPEGCEEFLGDLADDQLDRIGSRRRGAAEIGPVGGEGVVGLDAFLEVAEIRQRERRLGEGLGGVERL